MGIVTRFLRARGHPVIPSSRHPVIPSSRHPVIFARASADPFRYNHFSLRATPLFPTSATRKLTDDDSPLAALAGAAPARGAGAVRLTDARRGNRRRETGRRVRGATQEGRLLPR